MAKYRRERGPGRATDREWRRPGLSPFREKPPDKKNKHQKMLGYGGATIRTRQGHIDAEGPATGELPQGMTGT